MSIKQVLAFSRAQGRQAELDVARGDAYPGRRYVPKDPADCLAYTPLGPVGQQRQGAQYAKSKPGRPIPHRK